MTHVNHAFLLDIARRTRLGGKFLDFGCGAAETVRLGLQMGLDIYGTDVFYDAQTDARPDLARDGLLNTRVFELTREFKVPFPDKSFDFIFSNQVMEHVKDLDGVLQEMSRVLDDDGVILSYFPLQDCLMEYHCEIPLAHRFRHDSKLGYYWLLAWRKLGYGAHHKDKTPEKWARDFQEWIHQWCHYRTRAEARDEFTLSGLSFEPAELDYVRFRLNYNHKDWMYRLFAFSPGLTTLLFTHFGGGAIVTSQKVLRRAPIPEPIPEPDSVSLPAMVDSGLATPAHAPMSSVSRSNLRCRSAKG
ncbi:MAG TPA: class I SAM-dependent methyltransferase [Candidatus Acidoferrum sp.]|jgi:SAM-dependent methyltransferase